MLGDPGVVLDFEFLLAQGIALVGVEAGGDTNKIRIKLFQGRQGFGGGGAPGGIGAVRGHGEVVAVIKTLLAGAGVGGVLVDRNESRAFGAVQDILGAIAVVHVEVEHGHLFGVVCAGMKGGDGDAVEKTKPHGALTSGVMAGRAEQGKVGFAGLSEFQRAQGAANGTACVGINIRIIGRIAVKRPLGLGDQPHVSFFVGAGDQGVGHFGGLVPGDLQLGLLAQQFEGAGHALRAFGMKFLRIVEATFIGDHVHGASVGQGAGGVHCEQPLVSRDAAASLSCDARSCRNIKSNSRFSRGPWTSCFIW